MFISVGSTGLAEAGMGGMRHIKRIVDKEPVVALSVGLGALGFAGVQVVLPIRRSLGYDTSQYDGTVPRQRSVN